MRSIIRSHERTVCRRGVVGFDLLREAVILTLLVGAMFWGLAQIPWLRASLAPADTSVHDWPIHKVYLDAAERNLWIVRKGHGLFRSALADGSEEQILPARFPLSDVAIYSDDRDAVYAIARYDQIVEVWWNGRVVVEHELADPLDQITAVAVADRGRLVVAVSDCGGVFVWRHDGKGFAFHRFQATSQLNRVKVSRDGRFAACVSRGRQIVVVDLQQLCLQATWGTPHDPCTDLEWSPDGLTLATVGFGGQLCLWDVATQQLQWRCRADVHNASVVVFSPGGDRLITGGFDLRVRVWDAASGGLVTEFDGHRYGVRALVCNSDGSRVFSGGLDGQVLSWPL